MKRTLFPALILSALSSAALAHDPEATYIANEGVLVTSGETKVMFDPLPLSGFGVYPEPRESDIAQMMAGEGIYAGIDAVFISHAHRDHFSAARMIAFMAAQPGLHVVAPSQALDMMRRDESWDEALVTRITALDMTPEDKARAINVGEVTASAVRIPHSGWPAPRRAAVQNMVYRVTLEDGATVMHMGDADVNIVHYRPHKDHWQSQETDMAFPPYWMLSYPGGPEILDYMNVKQSVGVHVPIDIPEDLKRSGADYFSVPGETREISK